MCNNHMWEAAVGEVLICEREPDNASNRSSKHSNISYQNYFAGLSFVVENILLV